MTSKKNPSAVEAPGQENTATDVKVVTNVTSQSTGPSHRTHRNGSLDEGNHPPGAAAVDKPQTSRRTAPVPPSLEKYHAHQRNRLAQRREDFKVWLEDGGESLKSAWTTCCPRAAVKNVVLHCTLPEVVEAVKKGRFDHPDHDRPVDLRTASQEVCEAYNSGFAEAEQFNRVQLKKAILQSGLNADPDDVEAITEQPKKNESQLSLKGFVYEGSHYWCCPPLSLQNAAKKGKSRAEDRKNKVPAVTFAGAFLSNRAADNFTRHTGLYPLDFDTVENLQRVKSVICADPHVALCFTSITGTGLKVCVLSRQVTTADEYSREYARVMAWAEGTWGIKADPANSDCSRLCFLTYDESIYVNWEAQEMVLADDAVAQATECIEVKPIEHHHSDASVQLSSHKTAEHSRPGSIVDWSNIEIPDLTYKGVSLKTCCDALRWVDPVDRETWRKVGAALKLGYADDAFEIYDRWSSSGGDVYKGSEDTRRTWESHTRVDDGSNKVIRPQSILKWAKEAGWRSHRTEQHTKIKTDDSKPVLHVFGAGQPASDFCVELFHHLAQSQRVFIRGGRVFYLVDDPNDGLRLELLEPAGAVTFLENFACFITTTLKGQEVQIPLDEKKCRVILKSDARFDLPPIEAVVAAPVLCEVNGKPLYAEQGYSRDLRLYISGELTLPPISSDEGVENLLRIVQDYDFASPSDQSRAIATLITPALKQGKFIKGHVPMFIHEANSSQSGKTKLAQTQAAIYGDRSASVAQRTGGVGSVDEALSEQMIRGRPFILLDNWRGPLNSMFLESVLTDGGKVNARALRTSTTVDSEKFFFALSSNGFSTTVDLCNRACIVRIKHRAGYRFPVFTEGDLPSHVKANHGVYLASVYAVVKEWLAQGKPRNDVDGHSFVEWAGILDWIVQNIFRLAPLLEGHTELTKRVAHPNLAILRQLCLQVEKSGLLGSALKAHQLADIATANGVDIGAGQHDGADAPALRIGKIMQSCYQDVRDANSPDAIECEGFYIRRAEGMLKRDSGFGTYRGHYYAIARSPIDSMPALREYQPDEMLD